MLLTAGGRCKANFPWAEVIAGCRCSSRWLQAESRHCHSERGLAMAVRIVNATGAEQSDREGSRYGGRGPVDTACLFHHPPGVRGTHGRAAGCKQAQRLTGANSEPTCTQLGSVDSVSSIRSEDARGSLGKPTMGTSA